ncbi:MAG: hypothetical protein AB7E52_05305 [Bdellovibrionales bacterium]
MRIQIFLAASALTFCSSIDAPPAWAICTPSTTEQTSCLAGPDKACEQLGVTTMDRGSENLIACMNDGSGGLIWKSMTSDESASGRSTITALSSSSCSYSRTAKDLTATYSCALPAEATHLKITTYCSAKGADAYGYVTVAYSPTSSLLGSSTIICQASGTTVNQSNLDRTLDLFPIPPEATFLSVKLSMEGNEISKTQTIGILPMIISK